MLRLTLQVRVRGRWVDVANRRGLASALGAARIRLRKRPSEPVRIVDHESRLVLWPEEGALGEACPPPSSAHGDDGRRDRPRPRRRPTPPDVRPPP